MTKQQYKQVKVGDKILLKDNNRIITVGDISKSPFFKFKSGNKDGFMIGVIWYPYQWCKVVK